MTATKKNPLTPYLSKRQFGEYPKGTVFPRWRLEHAGDVEEMLQRGLIEETDDPVTEQFTVPEGQPQMGAPPAEMVENVNELNKEVAGLKSENDLLRGKVAELEEIVRKREESMSRLSDAHNAAEAKTAAESKKAKANEQDAKKELKKAQERIKGLEAELAELRAPVG